jgi:hypothetical protein
MYEVGQTTGNAASSWDASMYEVGQTTGNAASSWDASMYEVGQTTGNAASSWDASLYEVGSSTISSTQNVAYDDIDVRRMTLWDSSAYAVGTIKSLYAPPMSQTDPEVWNRRDQSISESKPPLASFQTMMKHSPYSTGTITGDSRWDPTTYAVNRTHQLGSDIYSNPDNYEFSRMQQDRRFRIQLKDATLQRDEPRINPAKAGGVYDFPEQSEYDLANLSSVDQSNYDFLEQSDYDLASPEPSDTRTHPSQVSSHPQDSLTPPARPPHKIALQSVDADDFNEFAEDDFNFDSSS